jgi:RHS repeat-associated protein
VTTRYLVDDLNPTGYLQVLEEIVGGAVQTRYTYGTSIVSQTRSVSSTPVTTYYGRDAHGNITFLTDGGGAVVSSYDYDAWGNVVASTGSTPNTRLFAGEDFDPDLGLLNLRARQYSLDTGRFLTLDPLDIDTADGAALLGTLVNAIAVHVPPHSRAALDLGGLSGVPLSDRLLTPLSLKRYLYANSDPVTFIDPLGQNVFAESTPLIQALLSPAVRAALVTLAVRVAVVIATIALAVTVDEIMDEIYKQWSGRFGSYKDFAQCWLNVAKPMLAAEPVNENETAMVRV